MNLKDKVVVITGGTKGFGKALADILKDRGSKVVICSEQDTDEVLSVEYKKADVRNKEEVENLLAHSIEKFGHIDIWINNAGVWLPQKEAEHADMKRVEDMFAVNVFGLMYGSQVATHQMKTQGNGMIINILSSAALGGRPLLSGYSATKFAADGFTKALRLELSDSPIKVISVYPGGMKTHLYDEAKPADFDQYMDPYEVAEKVIKNIELDSPEEEQILKRPVS